MKNILIIIIIACGINSTQAQVGIERDSQTEIVRGDGLMDFPENATKGILLPRVDDTSSIATEGTVGGAIAFNMAKQRVEFYNPDRNTWFGMTDASAIQVEGYTDFVNIASANGVIVEDGTGLDDAPTGVLVLESNERALILPQVPDATQLPSPKAGTICFDMASNSIAVFNGEVWSFWN